MTGTILAKYVLGALVGWLAALSVGVVGYLLSAQVREMRRNRRLEEKRELLG